MELARIYEKMGQMDAKISAAHDRVDRLEAGVRDDLEDIKECMKDLGADIKVLNANMNRGKGWTAAILFLAGSAGAGLVELLALIFR